MTEERLLFSELAGHLVRMAWFKVNTGLREPWETVPGGISIHPGS
jgi:hypothetical protein